MKASVILIAIFLFLMLMGINLSLFSNTWSDNPLIIGQAGFRNGLWTFCNYTNDGKLINCSDLNTVPIEIKVVRAFTILSLLSGLAAAVMGTLYKDKLYLMSIFTILVIIFTIISMVVYTVFTNRNNYPWAQKNPAIVIGSRGSGFWVNIQTIISAIIVTIISFIKFN